MRMEGRGAQGARGGVEAARVPRGATAPIGYANAGMDTRDGAAGNSDKVSGGEDGGRAPARHDRTGSAASVSAATVLSFGVMITMPICRRGSYGLLRGQDHCVHIPILYPLHRCIHMVFRLECLRVVRHVIFCWGRLPLPKDSNHRVSKLMPGNNGIVLAVENSHSSLLL